MLVPFFEKRNELLFRARNQCGCDDMLKANCIDAKKDAREAIRIAKNTWVNDVAESVHSMRFSPKEAWKAIKTLKQGHSYHHKKKECVKFLMADGSITKNDNEVASALETHFSKLFNRNVPIDWMHVQNIPRYDILNEISGLMSMPELS